MFLSGENLFDGRHCSKWKKIQDMAYVWGRWVIVTQCGKLLDGRHCSKWEEIQDMAYVWGGGLLVLSGENLFDG